MKQKTVLMVTAAAGAVLLVMAARRGPHVGGDAERMGGVRNIYGASAGQQAGVNAAVASEWRELENSVFKSQPDFWA